MRQAPRPFHAAAAAALAVDVIVTSPPTISPSVERACRFVAADAGAGARLPRLRVQCSLLAASAAQGTYSLELAVA